MKKKIALVCCRGGSKGIKKKNIKLFNGKPLLHWTYKNIENSKIFDHIFLSTDDYNIAKLGKRLGFSVPQIRPKKLALDYSDVFDTHKFFFKKNKINDTNSLVCIVNNNPFISSSILKKTFKKFKISNFKFITMCALKIEKEQIFFRQTKIVNNKLFPIFKNDLIKSKINRQSSIDYYYNTGDLRWGKPSDLDNYKKFNRIICKNGFKFIMIDKKKYQDLNNLNDWKVGEKKFKLL